MSVLYLLTSPKPAIEGTDAVFQEVEALRASVGGEMLNLNPRKMPGAPFPQWLFGFHALPALRSAERRCEVNHLYFSIPYFFPVLRLLRNPIVYTVVACVDGSKVPANLDGLKSLHRIVVSAERDANVLRSWGLSNCAVVPPAIDRSRFAQNVLPLKDDVTLLMASAPWVEEQFDSKGIDTLLRATAQDPGLKLILLWRGLLLDKLLERIERLGIEDSVEVVTDRVNVNDYLRRAHAAVLLAKRGDIVKAYPHSLIESLVAGKPVVLTGALSMADYVRQQNCGIVIDDIGVPGLLAAIEALRLRYATLAENARRIESHVFSEGAMIESYKHIYGL